jgi:hypothetical protein
MNASPHRHDKRHADGSANGDGRVGLKTSWLSEVGCINDFGLSIFWQRFEVHVSQACTAAPHPASAIAIRNRNVRQILAGEAGFVFDLVFDDVMIESGEKFGESGLAERFGAVFAQRAIQGDEFVVFGAMPARDDCSELSMASPDRFQSFSVSVAAASRCCALPRCWQPSFKRAMQHREHHHAIAGEARLPEPVSVPRNQALPSPVECSRA